MGYELRELTPDKERCFGGIGCPAIYETREITPKRDRCVVGACPSVYDGDEFYLIIGQKIDPKDAGLVEKVGEGEALIKVPKRIIDEREK